MNAKYFDDNEHVCSVFRGLRNSSSVCNALTDEFRMVLHMDVFLDVHNDMFGNNRLPFLNNKPMFLELDCVLHYFWKLHVFQQICGRDE